MPLEIDLSDLLDGWAAVELDRGQGRFEVGFIASISDINTFWESARGRNIWLIKQSTRITHKAGASGAGLVRLTP